MNNKHLSWNKEINNNFIIASRAYFLHGPPMPIFCYMRSFIREKIISKLSGRESTTTRRNLGGTNLGLRWSCSTREISLREGEIITIVITNDPLIGRGSISIYIFTSTISSQTLVHLLYPIFLSKPQIGTCGLLVVLITPCSWCYTGMRRCYTNCF